MASLKVVDRIKHIDDEQCATVEEHYSCIIDCPELIDPVFKEVLRKDMPEWYDSQLFRKGQQYYKKNLTGFGISNLAGAVVSTVDPNTKQVLVFTNQSSTAIKAYKRYGETILHFNYILSSDAEDDNSKFYKSLNTVRWKHCNASRRCVANNIPGIHQRDMALAQFGFLGFILTRPKMLNLTNEPENREAICHVWRVVGHLLGIPPKLNVCRKNDAETTELCRLLLNRYYKPIFIEHEPHKDELILAMTEGISYIFMGGLNQHLMFYLLYKLGGLEYNEPLSLGNQVTLIYAAIRGFFVQTPVIGHLIKYWDNQISTPITYWLLENFPIFPMIRLGVEQSKINLYPKIKAH